MHQTDSYKLAGKTRIPEYELSMAFFTHCFHTTICNKKKAKGRLYFTLLLIKGHEADLSHISVEIILNCQTWNNETGLLQFLCFFLLY